MLNFIYLFFAVLLYRSLRVFATKTNIQLENPMLSEPHNTLAHQGDYEQSDEIITKGKWQKVKICMKLNFMSISMFFNTYVF